MNRTKKLLSNTMIFGLGTIASKLLQYLLLPFYTTYLSTSEYGTIDTLQNLASLVIPIVSLTIYEGIFRYAMDKSYDSKLVFTTGTVISIIGSLFGALIVFIINIFVSYQFMWITYIYIVSNIFRTNCSQFVRAKGHVKLFSIDNLFLTFSILVFNILCLVYFDLGIFGYMFAYAIGNFLSLSFLFIFGKLYKDFTKPCSKKVYKEMITYSAPLIPNTICWWVTNSSDRFMITSMVNASANGLYAIANKIPSAITIFVSIFLQAWQMTANDEVDNKDISNYFSSVFKYISTLLLLFSFLICFFSKLIIYIMTNEAYFDAWIYIPILALAIVFFTKAQFLGTVYTTFKKTSMAFYTNLFAAVVNLIGNFILIPFLGAYGAAIATMFSYFLLFIIRTININKFIKFKFNLGHEVLTTVLLVFEVCVVTFSYSYNQLIQLMILALILLLEKRTILNISQKFFILLRR